MGGVLHVTRNNEQRNDPSIYLYTRNNFTQSADTDK